MSAIIRAEKVFFEYSPDTVILRGLDFTVEKGDFVSVAGPNGAGKTTLLRLLGGLLKADSGLVEIDGKGIGRYKSSELAKRVSFVQQETAAVYDFTVEQTVMMGRTPYIGALGFEGQEDREIVDKALELTEIGHLRGRIMTQLSGGEKQRVFIARAVAQDTEIMLLDEPTSFLDLHHQVGIYDLLRKMRSQQGKTVVTVSHDLNLSSQYCDKVLLLDRQGGSYFGAIEEVFSKEMIEKVFSVSVEQIKSQGISYYLAKGRYSKYRGSC